MRSAPSASFEPKKALAELQVKTFGGFPTATAPANVRRQVKAARKAWL